jgi:flagellar protein FlaG
MTSAIQFSTPPNPTVSAAAGPAPVPPVRKDPAQDAPGAASADLRLVIEEDTDGKGFIYKTLDRRTGEVVQVFPRDTILKLQESDSYSPGTVVDQRT